MERYFEEMQTYKKMRIALKLSLKKVAELVGISKSMAYQLEQGLWDINCDTAKKYINYLTEKWNAQENPIDLDTISTDYTPYVDLTGQHFGRLTVIKKVNAPDTWTRKRTAWLCKCDCGTEIIEESENLRKGRVTSCGCWRDEKASQQMTTHGLMHKEPRLYRIWCNMKSRCELETNAAYKDYGGRGITVCDEWRTDFAAFVHWARQNGYSDNLTIDRINNDKGYYPTNCRWATAKQQANNRRKRKRKGNQHEDNTNTH